MAIFNLEVTRQYEFKGTIQIEADSYEDARQKAAETISGIELKMGQAVDNSDTVDGTSILDFLI